jgi:multisubunit Na+/H+ antiporter MnhC subunit
MSSIFSAQGGYGTAQTFVDGLRPALVVGSAVVALAGVAALLIPTARRAAQTQTRVVAPESPQRQDLAQAPALETASR